MFNKNNLRQYRTSLNKTDYKLILTINKHHIPIFILIGIIGFLVRLYYAPFDIPISLDGMRYFWYALDTSILGHYPTTYSLANTGWPTLLSIFFSFLNSDNFLDYMVIQRLVSIIISSLTIIPIYFLITKFFDKYYALIGSSLFIFEPRIIQNSLLGITDPLFVFLSTSALVFFLKKNMKASYVAFFIIALGAIVRYEGLLLLIPLSIMFFFKHKTEKNLVIKFLCAVIIFLLVLIPVALIRIETSGYDGFISHVKSGTEFVYYTKILQTDEERCREGDCDETLFDFVLRGFVNLIKTIGIIFIPNFLLFLPSCVLLISKKRNYQNNTLILFTITMLIPILYVYARNLMDTRYLFVLFPIFSIVSLYFVNKILHLIHWNGILFFIIIISIIFVSIIFIINFSVDYDHEKEAFYIAKWIVKNAKGVNELSNIAKYHSAAGIAQNPFPVLSSETMKFEPIRIDSYNFNLLDDYLKFGKKNGLTHLVVDGKHNMDYFNDIFFNENNYQYLIKEFDSSDYGFRYHVKIYKIDYDIFENISN